jgi:alpha-ketoglutarate-dependent taurine dioxygenase
MNQDATADVNHGFEFGRRHIVSLDSLVRETRYSADSDFPWLVQPSTAGVDLIQWALNNRDHLESVLCERGAILFRGFALPDVESFRRFVSATSNGLVKYTYRASPRKELGDSVYTSTEYPADQSIFPHNEHAFSPVFPRKVFFFCQEPAGIGGQTPIGSGRRIRDSISLATREKFRQKQIMYIRNYSAHMGLPWQIVFQTGDPSEVEAYCREHEILCRWKPEGGLFTQEVRPAFFRHPVTSEELWFNHATFFHITTLSRQIREMMSASYGPMDLPNNTFYGDGSDIEPEVLEELRAAYQEEMITFQWHQGDLLLLDNMLAVHARTPYQGSRRILVGMADPVTARSARIC